MIQMILVTIHEQSFVINNKFFKYSKTISCVDFENNNNASIYKSICDWLQIISEFFLTIAILSILLNIDIVSD